MTIVLRYLEELAHGIAVGSLPVADTLDVIHARIVNPLDHGEDVKPWCLLWEGLDPVSYEDVSESAVRDFARQWLAGRGRSW